MNSTKCITVLLADDHTVVREGLSRLLEAESDVQVVGEAATGRKAVELAQKLSPDVVIMDIAMPQMNGLEATRQILKARPEMKVLILSAHSDDAYVASVMALGAAGYLIKQTSSHFLAEAIREVHAGKTFYSPSVARRLRSRRLESLGREGAPAPSATHLSSREMEVLQLIAEGEANKQIAEALSISVKTVEKHRDHLMHKLDIHDTAGLTRYAIKTGVIECGVQLTII